MHQELLQNVPAAMSSAQIESDHATWYSWKVHFTGLNYNGKVQLPLQAKPA